MKSKRLAITISGAVSLGSYEAGVLYEVFTALAQHNLKPGRLPQDRIEIDILTGASAGAMTAAIGAQILAGHAGRPWQAYDNPFFNAWVKQVDLRGLVQLKANEDPMHSILSSDEVRQIGQRMITDSWEKGQTHPAAGPDLCLGMALTNLVGIDERAPSRMGTPFPYTRYQDGFLVDHVRKLGPTDWQRVRDAAIASGAFPVAFRVCELMRTYDEIFPAIKTKSGGETKSWDKPFVYTDGGVFDNQPLGMARSFAAKIDAPWENDRRFYLFVSPWEKGSSIAKEALQAKSANLMKTLGALVGAIFNQARFRDWVRAERMNRDLDLLNERAEGLAKLILAKPELIPSLKEAAGVLAQQFIDKRNQHPADPDDVPRAGVTLATERERLRRVFSDVGESQTDYFAELSAKASPAAAEAWIDALLVFEYAGRLESKAEMAIYGITAADHELASGELHAFAGFFDERFRLHDYEVGRMKARNWLKERLVAAPGHLGPIEFTPDPASAPQPDPRVRNLPLKDMPVGPRKMLLDAVTQRTDRLIDDYIKINVVGWAVRSLVKKKVRGIVAEKLGL